MDIYKFMRRFMYFYDFYVFFLCISVHQEKCFMSVALSWSNIQVRDFSKVVGLVGFYVFLKCLQYKFIVSDF